MADDWPFKLASDPKGTDMRTAQNGSEKIIHHIICFEFAGPSPFPEGGWWRASFEPHGPKYTKHMWVITLTVETTVKGSELSALFCARPHGCLEPMALPFEIDLLFPNVSQKAWLMTDPSSLPLIRKARIWGQLWDRLFWIQKAWITEWLRAKKSFIMSNYLNMLVPFHGPSKLCSWFERRRAWLISGR